MHTDSFLSSFYNALPEDITSRDLMDGVVVEFKHGSVTVTMNTKMTTNDMDNYFEELNESLFKLKRLVELNVF